MRFKEDLLKERDFLVKQLTEEFNLDFITYFLSEKDLEVSDRVGPHVTIIFGWYKDTEAFKDGFEIVRGVAICSKTDPPSRLEGFNRAARRVLRAMRDGQAPIKISPLNEHLRHIWGRLLERELVDYQEIDGRICDLAASTVLSPTRQERLLYAAREARRQKHAMRE